jgi:glycogen operon protein
VRRYWKSDEGQLSDLAYRLTGSSDLYERNGRRPSASINFITAHDGFTVNDLVSYNEKHNEANGEDNQDGANDNHSWNMGAEGPTDNQDIVNARGQQKRNFLATLLLSQGVPMILMGDEAGRTQNGNNNAYCQDNELTWFDWSLDERKAALLNFTRKLIALRAAHPNLRRRNFYQDRKIRGSDVRDIVWYRPAAEEMTDEEWGLGWVRCLGVMLNGATIGDVDESGAPVTDDTMLLMLNCHHEPIGFSLPDGPSKLPWAILIDTHEPDLAPGSRQCEPGQIIEILPLSLILASEANPPAVSEL